MAKGYKAGGGGLPLNFKVVGNPKPQTAKENTIWIDTDAKITGWEFSLVEPAAATEGMVWFQLDATSTTPINALKKNAIRLSPILAKQYIGGAWAEKNAQCRQGGEWVEIKSPKFWIVKNGVETAALNSYSDGTVTKSTSDGLLHIQARGDGFHSAYRMVDLTNYKNMVITGEMDTLQGNSLLCIWDKNATSPTVQYDRPIAQVQMESTGATLPVEAYTGQYKVGVTLTGSRLHKIENFYLE